jgi:hypothetical protein
MTTVSGFRHWLLRRVRTPPLAAPIDLAAYAISDGDMSALLKTLTNDQHTHKGRKMGRCLDHFRDEGSAADPIADRTKAAAEPCWGLVDRRHKLGVEDGTGFCEQPCGDALILPQKGTTLALQLLRLWIDHWQKERDNKGRGNFWV